MRAFSLLPNLLLGGVLVGSERILVRNGEAAHLMGAVKADVPSGTTSLEERFRAGTADALDEVVRTYEGQVTRLVYRLAGWSGGDIEDVVQEVFVAAVRSARTFDGRSSLGTWLTRIAINQCRAERRKRLLRARYWRSFVPGRKSAVTPSESNRPEIEERAARVTDEVRRLATKYREVVVLRYLEGMEIDDVARAVGASRGAVEVRLHRARELLRGTLADVWEER